MAPERIIAGTMRLLDHDRDPGGWADFYAALWDMGIRKLHVSHEYESWPLVRDCFAKLRSGRRVHGWPPVP